MIKKHKKGCSILSYIEQLIKLVFVVTVPVSVSAFASLSSIPLGIASSVVGSKFVQ